MRSFRKHWPEYLIELIGLTWIAFASFGIASLAPRALIGLGAPAAIVLCSYTRWGRRSGAHFNPAFTLAFFVLGKLEPEDALFYVMAQFAGAALGAVLFAPMPVSHAFITAPGSPAPAVAFAREVTLTFVMFLLLLRVMNSRRNRYTPLVLGAFLWLVWPIASPAGAGLNPARGFAVALLAGNWALFWIELLAPPIGAVAASLFYARTLGRPVYCAKLIHPPIEERCLFRCGYRVLGIEPWQAG